MPDPILADDDDLGAAVAANWDAQQEQASEPSAPSPSDGTSPPGAASAPSPETASPGGGERARGPDGKFIQKAEAPKVDAKAPVDPGAAPAPEFRIPEKWPPQVKERLAAIHAANPEHAQFVLEQYEHFRRESAQAANRVSQTFKQFDDLLAPGRQQRAMKNIDDTTYVRQLIAAGDYLDKNPVDGLRKLAQTYGIDLQQLANPEAGGEPEIPPYVRQTQAELQAIKQYIASQHQQAESHQLQQAASWIESFAAQRDASTGQPLYPHFDELLPEIVANVQMQRDMGQTVDVHVAYERAKRMNDNVWLKEQTARTKAERDQAEARRLREIEDAKRAGFSASGSGAATSEVIPDDIGALVSRNYDKYMGS